MRFSGGDGKAPFRSCGRAPWKTAMRVVIHLARGVSGTSCVDDECRARVREPASRDRAFRVLPMTDFPGTCRLPSFRLGFRALPGSDPAGGRNGFQDVAPPGSAVPSTRDRRVRRRSRFDGSIRRVWHRSRHAGVVRGFGEVHPARMAPIRRSVGSETLQVRWALFGPSSCIRACGRVPDG